MSVPPNMRVQRTLRRLRLRVWSKGGVLVRTGLIGLTSFLVFTAHALAQTFGDQSSWSSALRMYGPLLLLVVVWLVIWKRGFGKGGYRRFIVENQQRMAGIEKHMGEISRQLERIAASLERSGR